MPRPFGPGPRGPMGPGPGFGPGPGNVGYNYFRPGGPNRPAPGGYIDITSANIVQSTISKYYNSKALFKSTIRKKGLLGGIVLGARYLTSGSLRYDSFLGKVSMYEKQFIEGRITGIQFNERRMLAAKKYYGYLRKIGYLDQNEYVEKMNDYAKSINVNYVDDYSTQQTQGRSR